MPFVPEVELDFVKYIALRKGVVERRQKEGSAYAYSGEERVRKTLVWARPVTIAIEATVRLWQGVKRAELLGSSTKVTEKEYPKIWKAATTCARTLGIDLPPIYVAPELGGGLGAQTLGLDEDYSIVLAAPLVESLSDDELIYVIGHECGHIHAGHVIFTTALYYLKHAAAFYVRWSVQPAILALQAWSRRAEITCDRAGLLCVKNLDVAVEATGKLAQSQKPFVPKRVEALRIFAKTELYRRHAGLGQDGIATHEADLEVSRLLSVI